MKSLFSGLVLSLIVFLCNFISIAESSSGANSNVSLVGTWQIVDLATAGFSSEEALQIHHMRIQFGSDGTYRKIILPEKGVVEADTNEAPVSVVYEGSYVAIGDTVWVHWSDPSLGDDYASIAQVIGDTLIYTRVPSTGQQVKMIRVPETEAISFTTIVPNLPVPDSLIAQLRSYRYPAACYSLVRGLYNIVLPESTLVEDDSGFLRVIVADFDEDALPEIVALMAANDYGGDYYLLVCKQDKSCWRIIYDPQIYYYYKDPELHLLGKTGKTAAFYTTILTIRGSGIYRELFTFYKLIDGRVYSCLSTTRENHIDGWGRYLNQEVKAELADHSTDDDVFSIRYHYNFYPGAVFDSDVSFESHPEIPFVAGKATLAYRFNGASRTYVPVFSSAASGLTEAKLSCLNDFAEDRIFVRAFQSELLTALKNGPGSKAKLIRQYMQMVQKEGHAEPPSGPVEQNGQAGDVLLYGPKKK